MLHLAMLQHGRACFVCDAVCLSDLLLCAEITMSFFQLNLPDCQLLVYIPGILRN